MSSFTIAELAFVAGLMEGEGTVRINAPGGRNRGILAVSCVNTDSQLIHYLQERWPGYCKAATGLRPQQRPAMVWVVAAQKAIAFLGEIEPFVTSDRMKARIEAAHWWQEIKSKHWRHRTDEDREEEFNCFMWMRHLNRRGVRT